MLDNESTLNAYTKTRLFRVLEWLLFNLSRDKRAVLYVYAVFETGGAQTNLNVIGDFIL